MSLRQELLESLDDSPQTEDVLVRRVYGADFKNYPRHRTGWMMAVHRALLKLMREGFVQSVESHSGRPLWFKKD